MKWLAFPTDCRWAGPPSPTVISVAHSRLTVSALSAPIAATGTA